LKGGKRLNRNFISASARITSPTTTIPTTTTTTPKPKKVTKNKRRGESKDEGLRHQMNSPTAPKTIYKIRSPNRNMSKEQIEDMLRASGLDLDNAEIQIIDAEEFDEHTSHNQQSRPRPITPTFRPFQPQRFTTAKPTTTTRPTPSTTKKIYVPHKDTERHEEGSFVYLGSHNLIFPGLYSEEN